MRGTAAGDWRRPLNSAAASLLGLSGPGRRIRGDGTSDDEDGDGGCPQTDGVPAGRQADLARHYDPDDKLSLPVGEVQGMWQAIGYATLGRKILLLAIIFPLLLIAR